MTEEEKTVDKLSMIVSLDIDINLIRTIPVGSRTEALARMIEELKPELNYIKQRLQKQGYVPLLRINTRVTV